jgi:hypothetical protein
MHGVEFKTEKDYERALARINDLMDPVISVNYDFAELIAKAEIPQ